MQTQLTTADAYNLVHDGILAFARAEQQGMRIDVDYCERKKTFLTRKIEYKVKQFYETELGRQWHQVFGPKMTLGSNDQLGHILYETRGIEPVKLTASSKKGATDEAALKQLKIPDLDILIGIRKLKKIRDTYLDAFVREQKNGILHPFFELHTVITFRSSSRRPNFQNIPKRDKESMKICRSAIYPRLGHQLMEVDFSSLEVSIAACYHKDPVMIAYLMDPDSDMHGDMAEQIFLIKGFDKKKYSEHKLLRNAAKNGFVFPQFYGDFYGNNAEGLCTWVDLPQSKWKPGMGMKLPGGIHISDHMIDNGVKSFDAFVEHLKGIQDHFWNDRFKVYGQWKEDWLEEYRNKGYFDLFTGFRCSGVMGKNEVINYPVQGAAFHCLLWSFIDLDHRMREEKWDTKLIGQIHDAVVLDVHPDELDYVSKVVKEVTCVALPKE